MSAWRDIFLISNDLMKDAFRSEIGALESGADQYNRRQYVRTVFCYLEAEIFELQRIAKFIARGTLTKLEPWELLAASETRYELNDNGELKPKPVHHNFKPRFKFAFAIFCKAGKCSPTPDYRSRGWQSLLDSVPVRNRITHPRSPSDLEITDDEVAKVREALVWFINERSRVIDTATKQILSVVDRFEQLGLKNTVDASQGS